MVQSSYFQRIGMRRRLVGIVRSCATAWSLDQPKPGSLFAGFARFTVITGHEAVRMTSSATWPNAFGCVTARFSYGGVVGVC